LAPGPGDIGLRDRIRAIANSIPAPHRDALWAFLEVATEVASLAAEDIGR